MDMNDPFDDMRPDLENIAIATNQPPQEAALGLAKLIEYGLVQVEGDTDTLTVDRLRAFAARYI